MNLEMACSRGAEFATVIEVERDTFRESFVTVDFTQFAPTLTSIEEIYCDVVKLIASRGMRVFAEKIHGAKTYRRNFETLRTRAYHAAGIPSSFPFSYVCGTPLNDAPLAGLQWWCIASHDGDTAIHPMTHMGRTVGLRWEGPGFSLYSWPQVSGAGDDIDGCISAQCNRMFAETSRLLASEGLGYRDVMRTWIYLARILDWYGEFNHVRSRHFATHGLLDGAAGPWLPASTGIQGQATVEECMMDVLASSAQESGSAQAWPIFSTRRQNAAHSYGSAFSRAMVFEAQGRKTVYISGTASINPRGETVFFGDPEAQVFQTLMSLASVLEQAGGNLKNIVSSTLYCKNTATFEAFQRVARMLQLPPFPRVVVLADVCRAELLFEMEAIAAV